MTASTRIALAAAACIAMGGCNKPEAVKPATESAATAPAEAAAPQSESGLAIEGEGLRLFSGSGSGTPIPFGTPQDTALGMVVGFLLGVDAPPVTTNEECGAGPTQFAQFQNGLQLAFQDGKFAGWFLDKAGLTTADGIGVGSTRAALDDAMTIEIDPESTLGVEFSAGDLGGFLTSAQPTGTVESLYAGLTCFFR